MTPKFNKPSFDNRCHLYIGKVAEMTGASRKAIRLYEERKLIPAPERLNRYRLYSDQHVFLVHMIKQAQEVGFSLAEIKDLIGAVAAGNKFPLAHANQLVLQKQKALSDQIKSLQNLRKRLNGLQVEMNQLFGPKDPVDSAP